MQAPLHALTKTLRDGRTFTLNLVPRGPQEPLGFWMQAIIDDKVVRERFASFIRRNILDDQGTPHGIEITMEVPDPDNPGFNKLARRLISLTGEEADRIEAATQEWTQRRIRRALETAPDAPRWKISDVAVPLLPGVVWQSGPGADPVMVLEVDSRYVAEDGRSFHLDAEEGYLYSAVVRAPTEEELAEW